MCPPAAPFLERNRLHEDIAMRALGNRFTLRVPRSTRSFSRSVRAIRSPVNAEHHHAQVVSRAGGLDLPVWPVVPAMAAPLLLLAFGGPLALTALALMSWYARTGRVDDIENFRGYPVHFESLWVPLVLGAAVLLAYTLTSGYSVLSLITMLTPVVVGAALLVREEPSGADNASLLLLAFILTSLACIHPVVVFSVVVPLLQSIAPDPSFVAIVFAMGWGLGCGDETGDPLFHHLRAPCALTGVEGVRGGLAL